MKFCLACPNKCGFHCPIANINDKPEFVLGVYVGYSSFSMLCNDYYTWNADIRVFEKSCNSADDYKYIYKDNWTSIPADIRREFILAYWKRQKEKEITIKYNPKTNALEGTMGILFRNPDKPEKNNMICFVCNKEVLPSDGHRCNDYVEKSFHCNGCHKIMGCENQYCRYPFEKCYEIYKYKPQENNMKKVTYDLLENELCRFSKKGMCLEGKKGLEWFIEHFGRNAEVDYYFLLEWIPLDKNPWYEWLDKRIEPLLEEKPQKPVIELPVAMVKDSEEIIIRIDGCFESLFCITKKGRLRRYRCVSQTIAKEYGLQLDEQGRIMLDE